MGFFIGLLTFVLVLDCLALILLVLMQLPKKDAGAGLAFGGGATDALFGAGSGNVLTQATKYAATTFFVLALGIGILQGKYHDQSVTSLQEAVAGQTAPPDASPATTPEAPASDTVAPDFTLETTVPAEEPAPEATTNAPAPE